MTLSVPDPVACQIGNLPIMWYGVFFALGLYVGAYVLRSLGRKRGVDPDALSNMVLLLAVCSVLGARAFYVCTHWSQFAADPLSALNVRQGGLVFFGGLIGGSLGVVWWIHRKKLPFWHVADACAVALPLGHALGRMGCLMNGCCHGKVAEWGLLYNQGRSNPYLIQLQKGLLEEFNQVLPVLPSQAFLATSNLLLFGLLLYLFQRKLRPGMLFALYLCLYPVARFLGEFSRGDYVDYYGNPTLTWGMTNAQIVSLFIFPLGLAVLWHVRRRTQTT